MKRGDLVIIKHIEANPKLDRGLAGLVLEKHFLEYPYDDEYCFHIHTSQGLLKYHQNRLEVISEKR